MGKTLKLKGFVMNRTQNLFGMDWIESLDFLNQLINSFCSSVSVNSNSVDKMKKELKIKFFENFSEGLGKHTFKIKKNVMPIFSFFLPEKSIFCR